MYPQYDPAEYPVNTLYSDVGVQSSPSLVSGFYAAEAWLQEVALGTPEAVAEYTDRGLLPVSMFSPASPPVLQCTQPMTTLAELKDKQIRASSPTMARQINELGAIGVSLPFSEVYEALQRGILDCLVGSHTFGVTTGTLEVAPHFIHLTTASWSPAFVNYYAGPRVMQLPATAQQLILEAGQHWAANRIEFALDQTATEVLDGMDAAGGEWLTFDPEVDARLAEINDEILADVEGTTLFDGVDVVQRARAASEAWFDRVTELGLVDGGPIGGFPEWFPASSQSYDVDAWRNAVATEILAENSPL